MENVFNVMWFNKNVITCEIIIITIIIIIIMLILGEQLTYLDNKIGVYNNIYVRILVSILYNIRNKYPSKNKIYPMLHV